LADDIVEMLRPHACRQRLGAAPSLGSLGGK
jgi:hypothetical protein